ncbi:MAG TPA: hypothetical protein VEA79_04060 [Phenylobacterium sp.]|nr:hypothetical protein [Phenylobacterium sp.]
MRKPTAAIAAALMLLGGQALASSAPQAGDRISPARTSSAESEGYLGLTAVQITLAIAAVVAAVVIYNEVEDDPDSP